MAERRMFSKSVIDSDAFVKMPLSAQALYFHLAMRADDDGFVNNHERIRNDIHATEDDLHILLAKRFLLGFESGVIVVKHWRLHNYIRQDRYKPTAYIKEKSLLMLLENGSYTEKITEIIPSGELGQPLVNHWSTEDRLGEYRVVEDSLSTQQLQQSLTMARERVQEEKKVPTVPEVFLYLKSEHCIEDAQAEAEKFVAWNALRGWDCLPHWKLAADLWAARMEDRNTAKHSETKTITGGAKELFDPEKWVREHVKEERE